VRYQPSTFTARSRLGRHILEKIITLACPRCGQAFIDFNGCMALTCSRVGCGCGGCPLAESIGLKPREFHIREADYAKAMTRAKVIKLHEYLDTLTEARKQHALQDCEREIRDLGLDPSNFDGPARALRPHRHERDR
jgi:hypothetical protein